jgi:hypothetical protein
MLMKTFSIHIIIAVDKVVRLEMMPNVLFVENWKTGKIHIDLALTDI